MESQQRSTHQPHHQQSTAEQHSLSSGMHGRGSVGGLGGIALAGGHARTGVTDRRLKRRAKRIVLALAIPAVIVVAAGAVVFSFMNARTTPDSVFADAIELSLSTKHVRQTLQATSLGIEERTEARYDFSRPADPHLYVQTKARSIHAPNVVTPMHGTDVEQYASLKDKYVRIQHFDLFVGPGTSAEGFKGKWLHHRQDGQPAVDTSLSVLVLLESAHNHLFGEWMFGNFSAQDKHNLKNFILNEKVYAYDAGKVKKQQFESGEAYVYTVTLDQKKQLNLIKKVAAIWGINVRSFEQEPRSVPGIDRGSRHTLYINIATKRLVRIDDKGPNTETSSVYTDYDKMTIPPEPAAEASYNDFVQTMLDASMRQLRAEGYTGP